MKVLYLNSSKDNRTPDSFSTHNCTIGTLPFESVKTDDLKVDIQNFDVIGVDEAQLFTNLKSSVLNWVENEKKIVIISGLNGDFRRKPFGEVNELVSYCDSVTKLTPFCISCKRYNNTIRAAHFTKRTTGDESTVLIGGKDLYIPTCRECFLK
jgi:thymidine kinase